LNQYINSSSQQQTDEKRKPADLPVKPSLKNSEMYEMESTSHKLLRNQPKYADIKNLTWEGSEAGAGVEGGICYIYTQG